ncbi:hypothetical protein BH23PSE1_BH23PSE1_13720 [soil metagenome]
MNRTELTLAIAGALFAAALLGWILRSIFTRLNAGGRTKRLGAAADLADRLHEAEEDRGRAERRLAAMEADCGERLRELEAELSRTQAALDAAEAEVEEVRAAYRRAIAEGPSRAS